jgi:hypothetical protein
MRTSRYSARQLTRDALLTALIVVTLTAVAVVGGCRSSAPPASQPASQPAASQPVSQPGAHLDRGVSTDRQRVLLAKIKRHHHRKVCSAVKPGLMRCHARVRTAPDGIAPFATGLPSGLTPTDLTAAYAVPAASGSPTVAIVDAQDDPTAEADLAVYRAQFKLPPCTTANGCFKKVNQAGATAPLPKKDTGWSGEIALDLDMVSAVCPACKILLVEANSASMTDLGAAVILELPSTPRSSSGRRWSAVAGAGRKIPLTRWPRRTSNTRASPSSSAPAMTATARSTRRHRPT